MIRALSAVCGLLAVVGSAPASAAHIRGEYLEARTADVYTGPCFSNAEIFITGSQAVLAWKVTEGSWQGVDVSGLTVAAALEATTTLSQDKPELAKSVLIVDSKATAKQREALVAMAKELAGGRLAKVVAVRTSPMVFTIESHHGAAAASAHAEHAPPQTPRASFWAPQLAEILTRPLDDGDHFCGNEVVEYGPLSKGVQAQPAFTLENEFQGKGLDSRWSSPQRRSSFVGTFSY